MSFCYNKPLWFGQPRRQDGPWAWLVLVYLFVAFIVLGGINFGFGVILPVLMKSFNENRERTALVGSLVLGMGLFSSVFASMVCEKCTFRIGYGLGLILIAVGFALGSVCRSVNLLYITYSPLVGIGTSLAYLSGYIALRQYFFKRYSLAIGIASAGTGVGPLAFGPVFEVLTDRFGWENTFRVVSGTFVFLFLFAFILDSNVEGFNSNRATEENPENPSLVNEKIKRKIVLGVLDLSVWKFPEYVTAVVAITIACFGQYTALIHLIKFSEELSISNASSLYVFYGLSTVIIRPISGRLCDVSFIKPRYISIVGAILCGLSTILLGHAQTYAHLAVVAVFYGIAEGALRVTTNILFMNTVDVPRRGTAYGQALMVTALTTSAGPAISGLMADKMGTYQGAFYMAGTVTILGGAVFCLHFCFFKQKEINRQEMQLRDQPKMNEKDSPEGSNASNHPSTFFGPQEIRKNGGYEITSF